MDLPKIVAMYRLKNAGRWIDKSLEAASSICDSIVIVDNGSTDDTVKICKNFPNVVEIRDQSSLAFDDTRDKNTLYQMALKEKFWMYLWQRSMDGNTKLTLKKLY